MTSCHMEQHELTHMHFLGRVAGVGSRLQKGSRAGFKGLSTSPTYGVSRVVLVQNSCIQAIAV